MTFQDGDYIQYTPESTFRRDGYAIVWDQRGTLVADDTWGRHDTRLSEAELATGTVVFSLAEFTEPARVYEKYREDDIRIIKTFNGITERVFVRKGAVPLTVEETDELARARRRENVRQSAELLAVPAEYLEVVARPLPNLTPDEGTQVADSVQWVERATRTFYRTHEELVKAIAADDAERTRNAVAFARDDYYEMYRAHQTLHTKVDALRDAQEAK